GAGARRHALAGLRHDRGAGRCTGAGGRGHARFLALLRRNHDRADGQREYAGGRIRPDPRAACTGGRACAGHAGCERARGGLARPVAGRAVSVRRRGGDPSGCRCPAWSSASSRRSTPMTLRRRLDGGAVWAVTGLASLCLAAILGVCGYVLVRGLGAFWPAPVVELSLRDGSVHLGEVVAWDDGFLVLRESETERV